MYNPLFTSDNPEPQSAIDPKSEEIFPNAMIETGFQEIRQRAPWPANTTDEEQKDKRAGLPSRPETVRFQGMRVAYFCVDADSTHEKLILNRIVSLKEDARKG